jgi:hypothetical protein
LFTFLPTSTAAFPSQKLPSIGASPHGLFNQARLFQLSMATQSILVAGFVLAFNPSVSFHHLSPVFQHRAFSPRALATTDCIPLPAALLRLPPVPSLPLQVLNPIVTLQAAPPASSSDFFVLNPNFPAAKPAFSTDLLPSRFSGTFSLPFASSLGAASTQPCSVPELFSCCSAPPAILAALSPTDIFSIPLAVPSDSAPSSSTISSTSTYSLPLMLPTFLPSLLIVFLSTLSPPPACAQDPDARLLLDCLSSASPITKLDLVTLSSSFRDCIRCNRISLLDGKLIVFSQFRKTRKCSC